MLVERLRKEWHARERAVGIDPALSFSPQGLVLGAGTVLVPADAERSLRRLDGQEIRILTLLSAAYQRPIEPSVLGQIDRAAKCWRQGEDCLALIHLALAGLHRVEDRREAARRVFMADGLMKAGVSPRIILEALELDTTDIDGFRRYKDTQLRVPKGSGRTSGQWTKEGAQVLKNLSIAAARFLGRQALGALRVAAENPYLLVFGLVLIPRMTNSMVEGEVSELPGLRYAWNRDEAILRLTYTGLHGTREIKAMLDHDGLFRDGEDVVGRLLPDETLAIDPAAVSYDLANKDGPNLCPYPVPDKPGRGEDKGKRDKDYEDQIKRLVNPDNPTPRGYGYLFINPVTGEKAFIDDCQHKTGDPVEIKGDYDGLLTFPKGIDNRTEEWLKQSGTQVHVTEGRQLFWVFSQRNSAYFARGLFDEAEGGREKIKIKWVPRDGGLQ